MDLTTSQAMDSRVFWQQAEDNCGEDGGHLASVYSAAENAALYYYAAQQSNAFPLWIGLKKVGFPKCILCLHFHF